MKEYPKINTIYKRDEKTKALILNQYSTPEIEYLKDNDWILTEKVDGMNIRVEYENDTISFKGRTDNAQLPTRLFDKLHTLFDNKLNLFREMFKDTSVCFYGEGYGVGIQKGSGYIPNDVNFILFDVMVGETFLERLSVEDIAKKFDIQVVPVICVGSLAVMEEIVRTKFNSRVASSHIIAEGLVASPKVILYTRRGGRIMTKLKVADFNITPVFKMR